MYSMCYHFVVIRKAISKRWVTDFATSCLFITFYPYSNRFLILVCLLLELPLKEMLFLILNGPGISVSSLLIIISYAMLQSLPKILGRQRYFAIRFQSTHAKNYINQKALRCKETPPPPKAMLCFADKILPHLTGIDL